jgi:ADP-heptose:LPS heptosyltransferase
VFFEDLIETKRFFSEGGVFISNDSGMAHLAGVSGLFTITIFTDFNPAAWHPRGRNISLILGRDVSDLFGLETIILKAAKERGRLPQ